MMFVDFQMLKGGNKDENFVLILHVIKLFLKNNKNR